MSRVALVLAHDGTDFAGWQFQPGERTVQGLLEEALNTTCGGRVVAHASSGRDFTNSHLPADVLLHNQTVAIRTEQPVYKVPVYIRMALQPKTDASRQGPWASLLEEYNVTGSCSGSA